MIVTFPKATSSIPVPPFHKPALSGTIASISTELSFALVPTTPQLRDTVRKSAPRTLLMPPSVVPLQSHFLAHSSPALISLPPPPSLIPVPRPVSAPPATASTPPSSAHSRALSDINDRTRLRFSTHSEEVIYDIDAPSASSLRPDITATRSPPTKTHSQEPNHLKYSK